MDRFSQNPGGNGLNGGGNSGRNNAGGDNSSGSNNAGGNRVTAADAAAMSTTVPGRISTAASGPVGRSAANICKVRGRRVAPVRAAAMTASTGGSGGAQSGRIQQQFNFNNQGGNDSGGNNSGNVQSRNWSG